MRIVIVGGVAAGMSAASRAQRHDPGAEVVVFERGEHISYGACGLPYVLGGDVNDFDALVARTPGQMPKRFSLLSTASAQKQIEGGGKVLGQFAATGADAPTQDVSAEQKVEGEVDLDAGSSDSQAKGGGEGAESIGNPGAISFSEMPPGDLRDKGDVVQIGE